MIIGIPKEILAGENRVAATPETVAKYRQLGFTVLVQEGAGSGAFFDNNAYAQAGAEIVPDAATLYARADLILKVKELALDSATGRHEIDLIKPEAALITFIHPAAPGNHATVQRMAAKRLKSFTMDGIPRTSRAQKMDALTSMSTITGYKSVIMAANRLCIFIPMVSTTGGMIKPAQVLVIGAGVVGLQAIATAKRLGAVVKAVDIRAEARTAAQSLGIKVEGFDVPAELAMGEGGYARSLPDEWLAKERQALETLVSESDMIILSALVPGEIAPVLITDNMVRSMRPGSVIIDVSIDQGGNCAATKPGIETTVHGVTVCGIKNIPGSVPIHSTWLYANNLYYYVENLFKKGLGIFDLEDDIVRHSLVTYEGKIVHAGTLKALEQSSAKG